MRAGGDMDDNLDFEFQDIMEFVAGSDQAGENAVVGEERREHGMFQFEEELLPAVIKVIGVGDRKSVV